jgi:hypothetical protein
VHHVWSEPTLTRSLHQGYLGSCSRTASGSVVFLGEDPLLTPHTRISLVIRITSASTALDLKLAETAVAYLYVVNRPTKFTDPEGLVPQTPGCDGVMWCYELPHVLNCCYEHDRCYERNGCDYTSWLATQYPSRCTICNLDVVQCVAGMRSAPPAPPDWMRRARAVDPTPKDVIRRSYGRFERSFEKLQGEVRRAVGPRR